MILPEFLEELFYSKNINLFETNFKIYLQKVYEYNIFTIQKWLKQLNKNYTIEQLKNLQYIYLTDAETTYNNSLDLKYLYIDIRHPATEKNMIYLKSLKSLKFNYAIVNIHNITTKHKLNLN